jgi:hypothetical protein
MSSTAESEKAEHITSPSHTTNTTVTQAEGEVSSSGPASLADETHEQNNPAPVDDRDRAEGNLTFEGIRPRRSRKRLAQDEDSSQYVSFDCYCGVKISKDDIDTNNNVQMCRGAGCETLWVRIGSLIAHCLSSLSQFFSSQFHLECLSFEIPQRNFICAACKSTKRARR